MSYPARSPCFPGRLELGDGDGDGNGRLLVPDKGAAVCGSAMPRRPCASIPGILSSYVASITACCERASSHKARFQSGKALPPGARRGTASTCELSVSTRRPGLRPVRRPDPGSPGSSLPGSCVVSPHGIRKPGAGASRLARPRSPAPDVSQIRPRVGRRHNRGCLLCSAASALGKHYGRARWPGPALRT